MLKTSGLTPGCAARRDHYWQALGTICGTKDRNQEAAYMALSVLSFQLFLIYIFHTHTQYVEEIPGIPSLVMF